MHPISTYAASALMLAMSTTLFGQTSVTYTDGDVNRTMNVESAKATTTYPEVCKEKKPVPVAVAPKPTPEKDSDGDGVVDSLDKCPDTPHGYKVDPNGCPVHVTLHVNFAFDSSVLPASSNSDIDTLTRVLKENPPAKIIIVGHTDHTGSDEYNQKLSERRAASLGKRLVENGIEADRIEMSGKGEKEPVASNETAAGRAQNRRIEVAIQ
ncbi:MAG: OmpA family protein [Campylobacterales bacterium]|nr:OmpA family protein [Campylobacterales bacterium]